MDYLKILREYDEAYDKTLNIEYMAKMMAAEIGLCIRLQKSKETLINELLESKLRKWQMEKFKNVGMVAVEKYS